MASSNIHALLTTPAIRAAAQAANLSEEAYYTHTISHAPAADIRVFMKAAIAAGFFDIRQEMIDAWDAVHGRQRPKLAKNTERFVVTQAQINQQFIDLTLGVMSNSARLLVNNRECIEGVLGGGAAVGITTGADYQMNYGGKNPVIYRIYNDTGTKEKTTVLINNTGSFFDTTGAAGKYFTTDSGTPDAPHYFWFKVTDAGSPATDPAPGGTGHEVDILTADTAAQIATKLNTVVAALSTFFTSSVSTATVTITNVNIGSVTDATAATSGATVTVTVQGQNSNLQNKYMALAGTPINQFGIGAQGDALLWFNVDSLGAIDTAYTNSQAGFETRINGMVPIQVNITSGSSALTVAQAIATAIRQNVPSLFQITEPSATLAVYNAIGATTNGSVVINMVPATEVVTGSGNNNIQISSISAIAPGMPVSGAGIAANTVVVSVSGNNVTLNNPATATSTGVYFAFNYLPIKVYNDQYNYCSTDNHILPVSTLVNTGGRGFNYSNCFQVIGQTGFDNSMTEPGGRIGFVAQGGVGGRNLSTIASPGTIASGSTRVSSFNMPYRVAGAFDQTIKPNMFVTGTGIAAGTTVWQVNETSTFGSAGLFSVKRILGTKDFAVVDSSGNPTTIAAYQTQASANPSVLTGTLTSVTSTGDLTFNNTTVLNVTTAGIVAGMLVQGPYIPGGTTVVSVGASSVVLSLAPLSTFTGQTLLFGNVTGLATQTQTCSVTINSPYVTTATSTANLCKLMTLTGTGIPAGAFIVDLSVSGSVTTIVLNINATATNASTALVFSPAPGMLVSGTGIPAGTFVQAKNGTTINLSAIPTTTGSQSLSFQPYYPSTTLGLTYASSLPTADIAATIATFIPVRVRTVSGGDVLTGNFEMFNDSTFFPYGLRATISNDLILSQPATAGSSAALTFTIANPVPVPGLTTTNVTPLKVGDILAISYDVDDQPVPDYKMELNVPFAGPTWDGTDANIDTWYNQYAYAFTIPSSSVTQGAVYSHNGFNYTARYTTSSSTSFYADGTGAPLSSGTLTLVSGTGPASLAFTASVQSTITVPYKVKGEGMPILYMGYQTSGESDLYGGANELGAMPTGKVFLVANPGLSRPFGPNQGTFTEAQLIDPLAWANNSPGNPFSDLRMSATVRVIGSLVERLNCGPMLIAAPSRNSPLAKCLYQFRPDLFRGVMADESFDNHFGTIDQAAGAGSVQTWKNVGIQLAGYTTIGTNVITMGSGGTNNYTVGIYNGMSISGAGIPAGTTVSSFTTNSVTMSQNATLTAASFLLFGGDFDSTTIKSDFLYEYCASNDVTSSTPNLITGDVTSGSRVIANCSNTTKILKGMSLTGAGISGYDTPIGCGITSGSNIITGIAPADIANIQVGMMVWGGGLISTAFTINAVTLAATNASIVLSVGVSSVVISNNATTTNANALLWFLNHVTAVTPTTITMSAPAVSTNLATSIRGRMVNRDTNYWRLIKLNSRKRFELYVKAYAKTAKYGVCADNLTTAQAFAGAGNITWAQTGGVIPAGATSLKQTVTYTGALAPATQVDDGTHPNLWVDSSTFPDVGWSSGSTSFPLGSAFNVQNPGGVLSGGGPIAFDNGAGVGIDQGSGIYRSTSLSQPFKFYGGKFLAMTIHQRNSLAEGETFSYGASGKIQLAGLDLPNLTTAELASRCQGMIYYRAENANNWTFTNPQSGWNQSVCIGEAMQWALGPTNIILASLNPYNDTGSAPINSNAVSTYILNQFYAMLAPGFDGSSREWQQTRNVFKPNL